MRVAFNVIEININSRKKTVWINLMNNEEKSPLRYYKHRQHLVKAKLQMRFKESQNNRENELFSELQGQVSQLQECALTFDNACSCNVCENVHPSPIIREDHYFTKVEAFSSLFTLLQHLTMIEADEAPGILGQLIIPRLFFKRNSRENREIHGELKGIRLKTESSFILFKSNVKSGHLEYPMLIKSLQKAEKVMRIHEEAIRKINSQESQRRIINYHEVNQSESQSSQQEVSNVVHKNYFNKEIPPYLLSSSKMQVLKSEVKKFIIHEQDRYIKQKQEAHKLKQSEPFCIFRYTSISNGERVSKYQIFTIETLKLYERNKMKISSFAKKQQEKLELIYIQSYTRIKSQQIMKGSKKKKQKSEDATAVTYFTEYDDNQKGFKENELFLLTRLEVKIKSGRISHVDPTFLDKFTLQDKIETILGTSAVNSTKKFSKLASYKTYKIINVLDIICRIKVSKLKIKWILNDHGFLVLVQCLEYAIDRNKSLSPKKNKDAHVQHIIDNGLEFLNDNWLLEDKETLYRKHDNVQEIVNSKIEERRRLKAKTEAAEAEEQEKSRIRSLSKSMNLQGGQKKKILEPIAAKYATIAVKNRKSVPSSLMSYTHELNPMSLIKQKESPKKPVTYGSPARKSYKLRPLKTESSPPHYT